MNHFAHNILILRKKKNLSQIELADALGLKNSTISNWERGIAKPDFDILVNISIYFGIDLNALMVGDLTGMEPTLKAINETSKQIHEIVQPFVQPFVQPKGIKGKELAIMSEPPTEVYGGKTRTIPILDARAAAGWPYTLDNSSFLFSQPTLSLPPPWFRSGEYVLIQIEGDSMHPTIYNGDWVFIRKLENVNEIKDSYVHVVLTHDGIVCKRLLNRVSKGHIALQSDNSAYPTYTVPVEEIISIWRVEMKMSAILRNENLDIVKRLSTLEADID